MEGQRQRRGCTRVDLPPVEWDVDRDALLFYVGRHADRALDTRIALGEIEGCWQRPTEEPESGCPGGYQQARLVLALMRFYRRRTDTGDRVHNPNFERCGDWLIVAAVQYLELEEERCRTERKRVELEALQHAQRR